SRAQRARLLADFESSGVTPDAFCAEHGIQPSTLTTWQRAARRRSRSKRPCFTPEERRTAVEEFLKSGRRREDFAKLWGCSASSLDNWVRKYRDEGPKSLETKRPGRTGPRPNARRIPEAVRDRIVAVARENPDFGVTRVANHLLRFENVRVSAGSVRVILREAGVEGQPFHGKRHRKKSHLPRRFERSRPGELWQSDITSFVLRREGRRVYLTVFLDDYSRYVVAWQLATHQRTPLVTEPLLEGIARFGKPKEVLTDQGRQYFAWRGKSGFQKLLVKEGIQHVVSRAHHPETLGKCERLWRTVGDEFWERAAPQDIDDARRRLGHWFAHYNHFRTHQGIGDLVPADRFFGVESEVRAALEREFGESELRMALGEAPRQSVYLTGRIGSQRISLHGEKGRLLVNTPDGGCRELRMDELGVEREEEDGERSERGAEDAGSAADEPERRNGAHASEGDAEAEACSDGAQAERVPAAGAPSVAGAWAVGGGTGGAAPRSAPDEHAHPRLLAGEEEQAASGGGAEGEAAARVAAESAGAVGHAGGPAAAASQAGADGAVRGPTGGESGCPEAPHREARDGACADGGLGARAANCPVGAAGDGVGSERRAEPWSEAQDAAEGESLDTSANESERGSGRVAGRGRKWLRWLRRTE
ncbi:MAG: IS3 family transposase, partial [Planctomycetes bacterium]|nr:IS3 family transposase [Planctomycetota bacterium]